jgi:hypothetical protein
MIAYKFPSQFEAGCHLTRYTSVKEVFSNKTQFWEGSWRDRTAISSASACINRKGYKITIYIIWIILYLINR